MPLVESQSLVDVAFVTGVLVGVLGDVGGAQHLRAGRDAIHLEAAEDDRGGVAARVRRAGWQFNRTKFGFSFGLKT